MELQMMHSFVVSVFIRSPWTFLQLCVKAGVWDRSTTATKKSIHLQVAAAVSRAVHHRRRGPVAQQPYGVVEGRPLHALKRRGLRDARV
jgi:hypothetical protein